MTNKIRWGILSTGAISRAFAAAVPNSATGQLAAVASRDAGQAAKFAKEFIRSRQRFGAQRRRAFAPFINRMAGAGK